MLTPISLALLLSAFPREQRGLAFGIFGIPLVVAPALGPVLGGYLVEHFDWRYIFWINVPIGLLGLFLGWRWLVESQRVARSRFDIVGIVLSSIGFASILYAASEVSTRGWNDPLVLALFGAGALALILFAVYELRSQDPIVDLRLFKKPVFTISSIVGWVSVLALFGAEFLMPLYLQSLRGLSPFQTGLMLLPLAITSGIVAPFAGVLYDRIGARPLLVVGFALIMANTWQLSQIKLDTSFWDIAWLLALRGVGLGLIIQPTLNAALSVVTGKAVRRATSLVNASRQIFLSLGVAMLASILQIHIQGPGIPHPQEILQGFEDAYLVTFWAAVASFCLSLLTPGWPAPRKVIELPIDASGSEAQVAWDDSFGGWRGGPAAAIYGGRGMRPSTNSKLMRRLMLGGLAGLSVATICPLVVPIPGLRGVLPPEQLADPDSTFVELNGLKVHYKAAGRREPAFVLLHGFGASLFSWRDVMVPLGEVSAVIAFDRPAFGLTERPVDMRRRGATNPYSLEAQAGLTVGLMDHLGWSKPSLWATRRAARWPF